MSSSEPVSVLSIDCRDGGAWPIRDMLADLPDSRVQLRSVDDLTAGIEALGSAPADVVILGLRPTNADLAPIDQLRGCFPRSAVIVVGGPDDRACVARAEEGGVTDYLPDGQYDRQLLLCCIRHAGDRAADRKRMDEALAEERSVLRALIDAIPDHIYIKDTAHRFVLANAAIHRFFGLNGDELMGKTDADLFPPDAASSFRWEEEQVLQAGQSRINREERAVAADGKPRWNLTTKVPLRDKRGKVVGLVGINRDITERKHAIEQLEQSNAMLERRERELMSAVADLKQSHEALRTTQLQLLQVEKMESVGRLAAGIAHEVKNPLAIIATGIEYLSQTALAKVEGDPLHRVLGSMTRAVRRADSVIRGLLDFSAPAALVAEPCDLNGVIRQALLLVEHELMRCAIGLALELSEALPLVSVDANKVEQVFLNLFINAIHAMPEGGTLTVRTRAQRLAGLGHNMGDNRAERFRAGDVVVVAEVDDTGHGIPPEKLGKVFDPFFTTKPTGKGTGLGLSVARTIVELHGGMLQLSNRPEGGARALLVLKATGDANHDDNPSSQEASADRGRRAGLHPHDGNGAAADRVV